MRRLSPSRIYYTHAFWFRLASSIVFTYYMVFQVEVALLTPLQMVLVGTALEVSAFVFEIPTGIVADLYSRRLSVIIGVFITAVGYAIQGVPNFIVIVIGSLLWGLGYTFTSGAHQAWITDEIGVENMGKVFLRSRQFGQAGTLIGIPVSVFLAQFSLGTPIIAGGGLLLLLGFFLIAFMGEENFSPVRPEERGTWREMRRTFSEGITVVRKRPVLQGFLLIGLFVGLYSEGYDRLWTAHLLENFTFPDLFGLDSIAWFGVLRIATIVLSIGFNEMVQRRLDLASIHKSVRMLQWLYTGMIGGLAVFALTSSFPLAVLLMLTFDVCRGLTFPIQETWTNQFIDSKVRATVLSVQSQVDALGQMSGGPVIGSIGNAFGLRAALSLSSAILLPVLPLYQNTLKQDVVVVEGNR